MIPEEVSSMNRTRKKPGAWAVVVAVLGLMLTSVPAPQAYAAPVSGFQAGNIISDSLFYDGDAMSGAQVQAFLNARVPKCILGTKGYEVGKVVTWGGVQTKLASKCMRDYTTTTQSRASNAYCAAYAGVANESAAQIIAKVGKACGISQKVLLVMLDKEQSLVSDTWPNEEQYFRAMGYACPDSGPGGSANCDPAQGGFYEQVYRAAWQLKVYKSTPQSWNYRPFESNYIQWNPKASCGGSNVYIQNRATAALYIYTPYQPNKAALDAGSGLGDNCSSYGNRNFYNMYKAWFGSPNSVAPVGPMFLDYWTVHRGWLGEPVASEVSLSVGGGGSLQSFEGGTVYRAKSGGFAALTSTSPIILAFAASGGIEGPWGWPLSEAVNQGVSGSNTMRFQGGTVVESRSAGAYLVPEQLRAHWEKSGGFYGSLGYPLAGADAADGYVVQSFSGGTLVSNGEETQRFDDNFLEAWNAIGGIRSKLGMPIAAPVQISGNGGGHVYKLQNGSLHKGPAGAFVVGSSPLSNAYLDAGGPAGAWGWPIAHSNCLPSETKCFGYFQHASVVWSASEGITLANGHLGGLEDRPLAMSQASTRLAGSDRYATAVEASKFGYPNSSEVETVIVANGDDFPDALSGVALSALRDAPLLLTPVGNLPGSVASEIRRLNPENIIVIGGSGVVSERVLSQIRDLMGGDGERVQRVAGNDRYETSLEVLKFWPSGSSSDLFIATGSDFADALAAGAAAGNAGAPVLLVQGAAPTSSARAQAALDALGVTELHVAGAEPVVSRGVVGSLSKGRTVTRYAGNDRYETAALIAEQNFSTRTDTFLASGVGFADALAGAALAGTKGAPLMLTIPECILPETYRVNDKIVGDRTYVLGGEAVLSSEVLHGDECMQRPTGAGLEEFEMNRSLYEKVNHFRFTEGLAGLRNADAASWGGIRIGASAGRWAQDISVNGLRKDLGAFTSEPWVKFETVAATPSAKGTEGIWASWMEDPEARKTLLSNQGGSRLSISIGSRATGGTTFSVLRLGATDEG